MTENDRKRFAMALTALAEYYGKTLSDGVISLYWDGLLSYDCDAIEKAMGAHIRNPDAGQWMPKVADIAKMLGGTTQDAAMVAWAKIDRALRHVGTYASVVFDDPLIHRVLHDMGGWVPLGAKTDDEWPFVAREFEQRYRGYRMRGEVPVYPPHLIGILEHDNSAGKFRVDPPVLIGDRDAALRVLAGGSDRPSLEFSRTSGAPRLRIVAGGES